MLRLGNQEHAKAHQVPHQRVLKTRALLGMAGEFRLQDLDRKQMEEERLARLAKKRNASSIATSESDRSAKRRKETPDPQPLSTAQVEPVSSLAIPAGESQKTPKAEAKGKEPLFPKADATPASGATFGTSVKYPRGVLLKTWAFRHERKNDIKIEEVIDKHNLTTAIFSSYCIDFDWLSSKLRMDKTKVVLILHERDQLVQESWRRDADQLGQRLELVFPRLTTPYGCMHSKLMLLFYKNHLRIAIPSANLVGYDWGETGVMENTIFLIDLPRLPEAEQDPQNKTLTSFATEMTYFLKQQGIRTEIENAVLDRFDFSGTRNLAFVSTVHGTATNDAINKTGFPALSKAVQRLGLSASEGPIEIDATASSIGALNAKFLHSLQKAFAGMEIAIPTGHPSKAEQLLKFESIQKPSPLTSDTFRIFYPSKETVCNSSGGPKNGGTLFLKPSYWIADSFPRSLFRDQKICRAGLLSHSKLFLVRTRDSAFIYSGSANISQSAWGNVSWDKSSKKGKLFAQNWECGVLIPVKQTLDEADISTASENESETEGESDKTALPTSKGGKAFSKQQKDSVLPMSVFQGHFDIPFEWPGIPYSEHQRPWDAGTDLQD